MQESSAATQITPGAIERNRSGSVPTPSGNRLVTITKNSSAVATSLRRRSASSRSRWTMQRAAPSTSGRCAAEVDDLRGAPLGFLMRSKHDAAAARHISINQRLDQPDRRGIESRERLVLPLPLGPASRSNSPPRSANDSARKSTRPPRAHSNSAASSTPVLLQTYGSFTARRVALLGFDVRAARDACPFFELVSDQHRKF